MQSDPKLRKNLKLPSTENSISMPLHLSGLNAHFVNYDRSVILLMFDPKTSDSYLSGTSLTMSDKGSEGCKKGCLKYHQGCKKGCLKLCFIPRISPYVKE